ncbi:class I SAM-dependent methyltransferase [Planctomycetes bacterium K23_9]|uniref:Methyltransferase type 11 domain-containing protein n=1 Tax=Stieleria marina TaxID=1930275 RepID=A0A517NR65_9BACT|nr:hypothetical protein K239x_15670 [Planctomycetes bacterium K23_9]
MSLGDQNDNPVEEHECFHEDGSRVVYLPVTNRIADRKIRTQAIISELIASDGGERILDIGGNEYQSFCQEQGIEYTMLNLASPQRTGTGGYHGGGMTYDGRTLPFPAGETFDLVILNFVLHHAAENALPILRQVKEIAARYVLIGEDLTGIDYAASWHDRNHKHQPGGVFRSDQEWRLLLSMFGLPVLRQYVIRREDDVDPGRVYRCMYLCSVD